MEGKKKTFKGHFVFVGESMHLIFFLLLFLEYCKWETRNVIPGIIFFYSIVYSAAHSIKMTIIKKGHNMRNNFLIGRMAL